MCISHCEKLKTYYNHLHSIDSTQEVRMKEDNNYDPQEGTRLERNDAELIYVLPPDVDA